MKVAPVLYAINFPAWFLTLSTCLIAFGGRIEPEEAEIGDGGIDG